MSVQGRQRFRVSLDQPMTAADLGLLAAGDRDERMYELMVMRDGAPVDCREAGVTAYLIRSDRQTVVWTGTGTETGAVFTLPQEAHAVCGGVSLAVRLTMDGVQHTVFGATGVVCESSTDAQLDPCAVVPTLDDLLAQIAAMEQVKAEAAQAVREARMNVDAALTEAAAQFGTWEATSNAELLRLDLETQRLAGETDRQADRLAGADRRLTNLEHAAQGFLYRAETDAAPAYAKLLPGDVLPWGMLDKVGGKTLVWNQMCGLYENASVTVAGVYITNNRDGSYTLDGASTGNTRFQIFNPNKLPVGHSYYFTLGADAGTYKAYLCLSNTGTNLTYNLDKKVFRIEQTYNQFSYRIVAGDVFENFVIRPQIFDLTAMFGAGYEPTAEEFRAMFPADYYPYSEPTLMTFSSDKVVAKETTDLSALVAKYFPGGMRSAGAVHDEIDLERGVAIQRVGSITLTGADVKSCAVATTGIMAAGFNTAIFATSTVNIIDNYGDKPTKTAGKDSGEIRIVNGNIYRYDNDYADIDDAKRKLTDKPLTIQAELAEPIETPIDPADLAGLTDLNVEAGGSLTFANQHGDDYRVPLPNQETFMIKLGGVNA